MTNLPPKDSTNAAPIFRRTAKVTRHDGKVVIAHMRNEVTLEGVAATLFDKVQPHLDGKHTVPQIAERVSEAAARLMSLLEGLKQAGLVSFLSAIDDARTMPGEEFYELHRQYCEHWLEEVYTHPLWEKITNGTATRAQVLGFAFEKYHYIEGAYEHMAQAASNATPEMMPHLARHFIEEYSHGDIYRKGLRTLFADDLVLRSQPLPSTRALVNFLSESAVRNSFSYYAGNELLQKTENSDGGAGDAVNEFYNKMKQYYPYTEKLIQSFLAHTQADQKLGHQDVFLEMCKSVPPLTRREVIDALNTVRSMAEHLKLFMDGIDVFYANFPTCPRVPCDLLSE
jgi:pyrroloquinoline quinone (PQQ) biosynthesis protein C